MKSKLIIGGVLLIFLLCGTIAGLWSKIEKMKLEQIRSDYNWSQIANDTSDIHVLRLRKDLVVGKYKRERDSLSEALSVKPRQIIKTITTTITETDTVKVPVYVNPIVQDHWFISDTLECGLYEGDAYLMGNDLEMCRTNFEYNNKVNITDYKKAPHIWFIRIGKWKFYQDISVDCGESYTREINYIK